MIDCIVYGLQFKEQGLDLHLSPDPEELTIRIEDPNRGDQANPVAQLRLYKEGETLMLAFTTWRENNADEPFEAERTLYDLENPYAKPLDATHVRPAVLMKIDGGVVHEVRSNVPYLDVRAFDVDKFEECGPEDPDLGMIAYPVVEEPLDTEEDWARYRREEMAA